MHNKRAAMCEKELTRAREKWQACDVEFLRLHRRESLSGWSSPVARQAHNLKAAGSNPAPATKRMPRKYDHHAKLDKEQPWRRWYKTARWQKLRWSVLTKGRFTCRLCKRTETDTSRLVCDHVLSHKGNERLFWSGPFQVLCKDCHDGTKQSIDKGKPRLSIGIDGWPLDRRGEVQTSNLGPK